MKTIALPIIGACSALLLVHGASAQQNAPAPMPTPIIEVYGCELTGDSDLADFRAVATRWNAWADRNNVTNYTAFLMTPFLYSAQLTYDVLWLGAWPNGTAMGQGEALWFAQGQDVQADFDAISDCSIHQQFAEVVIRAPEGPPPENGIAMFQDCELHDGRIVPEAIAAARQWAEYVTQNGSDQFIAFLFPLAGESDEADYNFKVVEGFANIEAYGRATDVYTGGGFMRAEELFGRLLDCDSPRVYALDRVRLAAASPQ
jgi:hypothetical protein